MKKTSIFLAVLLYVNISAQESLRHTAVEWVNWGLFAGSNITSSAQTGRSVFIEGRAKILPRFNFKISVGYSSLYLEKNLHVTRCWSFVRDNMKYYQIQSFDVKISDFSILPYSIGLEYVLFEGGISPYIMFEGGHNFNTANASFSNNVIGEAQAYNNTDEIPKEYRDSQSITLGQKSYRLAFGLGTKIGLTDGVNLEVRYLYNINTKLINSHQLLMGISI